MAMLTKNTPYTNLNRFNIRNFDLCVGDWIQVSDVRTQGTLDYQKGLGWVAYDVIVQITKVNDLTIGFNFNGEFHLALKDEVKKTKKRPSLFGEYETIKYAKNSIEYRMAIASNEF